MESYRDQAYKTALSWGEAFVNADNKARQGEYKAATEIITGSTIPDETKNRLLLALKTEEPYAVKIVFQDYEARIASAFSCEKCWEK